MFVIKWTQCGVKATLILALASSSTQAATISLDAIDRGWYMESGQHIPTNLNYIVGWAEGTLHRNWEQREKVG